MARSPPVFDSPSAVAFSGQYAFTSRQMAHGPLSPRAKLSTIAPYIRHLEQYAGLECNAVLRSARALRPHCETRGSFARGHEGIFRTGEECFVLIGRSDGERPGIAIRPKQKICRSRERFAFASRADVFDPACDLEGIVDSIAGQKCQPSR